MPLNFDALATEDSMMLVYSATMVSNKRAWHSTAEATIQVFGHEAFVAKYAPVNAESINREWFANTYYHPNKFVSTQPKSVAMAQIEDGFTFEATTEHSSYVLKAMAHDHGTGAGKMRETATINFFEVNIHPNAGDDPKEKKQEAIERAVSGVTGLTPYEVKPKMNELRKDRKCAWTGKFEMDEAMISGTRESLHKSRVFQLDSGHEGQIIYGAEWCKKYDICRKCCRPLRTCSCPQDKAGGKRKMPENDAMAKMRLLNKKP